MEFMQAYQEKIAQIDAHIHAYLHRQKDVDPTLLDAISYSVLNGGKRIRSILCLECAGLFQKECGAAMEFAMAVEMIHAYSLVHDDLPCMDDDDFRRGKPSCHKKYGEAMAVLCGDALQNLAFEVMADAAQAYGEPAVRAMRYIAKKSGIHGMIGGQALDIRMMEKKNITQTILETLIDHKTTALIQAAAVGGALCAGGDEAAVHAVETYAYHLGMAFQIRDDIEDEQQDGGDGQSPNFLNLLGREAALKKLEQHKHACGQILSQFEHAEFLLSLNEFLFADERFCLHK